MPKLFAVLLLISFSAVANTIDEQCPEHVLKGAPVTALPESQTQYICKTNYAVHYRYDTKTAEYVAEHVTIDDISGPARRRNDFRADPAVPREHQSQLSDYAGSGYDRGHLAAGANNTANAQVMSESFFLSNMVPQNANHNRGIWRILETLVRNWVQDGKDIYVISGTIYQEPYATIGENAVGVPTYLWKVIVDYRGQKGIAFVIPNQAVPVRELPQHAMTIREVEEKTGLNFHPRLPAELEHIEVEFDPLAWPGLVRD